MPLFVDENNNSFSFKTPRPRTYTWQNGIDSEMLRRILFRHKIMIVLYIVYTLWPRVDEWHMKLAVSLPLNTAQGSRSVAPMGRG